jgi:hypothetical protein
MIFAAVADRFELWSPFHFGQALSRRSASLKVLFGWASLTCFSHYISFLLSVLFFPPLLCPYFEFLRAASDSIDFD